MPQKSVLNGMIRKVLFKVGEEWVEGLIHGFTDGAAVVENLKTNEMNLVPVAPDKLKFASSMEDWVKMQQEAQARMQAQQVVAMPGNNFRNIR